MSLSLTNTSDLSPSPDDGKSDYVGPSGLGLGGGTREMLDLVNRLHNTGVQVDIDLPQVAVIGSQSAGKSSLIESISGITLPRAAGTCTRCPTECRLSKSNTKSKWVCQVTLKFLTDSRGQPISPPRIVTFGEPMYDKSQVEERIRRAQRAILNPEKDSRFFLEGDEDDKTDSQLPFSSNLISLQICGDTVEDLSFVDLPGLIATTGQGRSSSDIDLVKSLVTSYIKKPSCVILLTVTCETDFENQGAYTLAKEWDPDGNRTVGVLTKPDRIPSGEEHEWVKFVRNEKEPLENNWFCVKQPSSTELKQNISWQQARKNEDHYFSMTAPWMELDTVFQRYLRTSNLVKRLSDILTDLIAKRLPEIQQELETAMQDTSRLLSELPKAPSQDPITDISHMIHSFNADLIKHLEGVASDNGLLQSIRPAQEKFRKDIRSTAPEFRPYERSCVEDAEFPSMSFLDNEEGPASLDRKRKREDSTPVIPIDDVLQRAEKARTRELPGNYPYIVKEQYVREFASKWKQPAENLCRVIYHKLHEYVMQLVQHHFSEFGQGLLLRQVKGSIQKLLREKLQNTEEMVAWLTKLEDRAFTMNDHYYVDYRDKFQAHFQAARQSFKYPNVANITSASSPESQEGVTKALTALSEIGLRGVEANDLGRLYSSDPMEAAIRIMAEVRAYFQVAYKRFVDNIPLAIDHELLGGLSHEALKVLFQDLKIHSKDGPKICQKLAEESTKISGRRQELEKKMERLRIANEELLDLSFQYAQSP